MERLYFMGNDSDGEAEMLLVYGHKADDTLKIDDACNNVKLT